MRWFTLILIGCFSVQASGAVINVPGDQATISAAIVVAVNGDVIRVAPGTYNENVVFNNKAIRIESTGGPEVTTIDATGLVGRAVWIQVTSSPTIQNGLVGFTVTGGIDLQGGGIYVNGSASSISNCIIEGNTADEGGGIYIFGTAFVRITGCVIRNNHANVNGGGMYSLASLGPLYNNLFEGNTTDGSGGAIFSSTQGLRMRNCIFVNNSAAVSGGALERITSGPRTEAFNCTFVGNSAPVGGTSNGNAATISHINCIIRGVNPMAGNTQVTYSNIQGGHSGQGNIDADPFFVDAPNGDYSLMSISPCIDAGDTGELIFCVDYGLQPRLVDDPNAPNTGETLIGMTIDMGAYEFQPPGCPADIFSDTQVNVTDLLLLLGAWGACP